METPSLQCIAVDDEPVALEILSDYIQATPFLDLGGTFHDPLEALAHIQKTPIDLLFLDINMPRLSGIQLLKSLPEKPMCILTTAYSEYALEGYDLDVLDYLLKPIEFDRFIKAATKAHQQFQLMNPIGSIAESIKLPREEFIRVKSGTRTHQVKPADIQWIEASGNYVIFHLSSTKLMALSSISEVEAQLDSDDFIRTHRSFIVSRRHIDAYESHEVIIGADRIPISRSYRKTVAKWLQQ